MPKLPFLKIFNLALYWESAWVGESGFWVPKLANKHVTNVEIEALSNMLSDCPELNEINVSIRFGNPGTRDPRQLIDSSVSVVDWKGCLKMCKVMDESLSRLQSETLGLVSFTFIMEELEGGADGVIFHRIFPFLSARRILRVSAIVED
jgi:hypothetical protein